jgi:hypothetical protein
MGGLPVPAAWTLTCLGPPENSFSTEVSRSVVVLDSPPSQSDSGHGSRAKTGACSTTTCCARHSIRDEMVYREVAHVGPTDI